MMDHWEMMDVYKALIAVAAGMIFGLERELKDKEAGLKTITIICLGSALFAILSYRIGGPSEPTRIASYVVSGIGFLGAGAIFKDKFAISGLTTAGIIWLSAAVGLSIGFGEFYTAATFMGGALLIIYSTPIINRLLRSKKITRQLYFTFPKENITAKEKFISGLLKEGVLLFENNITLTANQVEISLEIIVSEKKLNWIKDYLLDQKWITSFSL
jgi:putative Mg2+ transporter-C (MgtC) family protein